MKAHKRWIVLVALTCLELAPGCGPLGKVNQGRVIEYDSKNGIVTVIPDSNYMDPGNPRYDMLPPVSVKIPTDPKQMGPTPEAGKLMRLDSANKLVVIYDANAGGFRTIQYTLIDQRNNVFKDDRRIAGVHFPIVDRAEKRITVHFPRLQQLIVFSVPDEYFLLPEDTWRAGDEIRYYYKNPGQALRLMNITKTDIT